MNKDLEHKVDEVELEDVKIAIDHKDNIILLDVRTPEEVTRGKLPGSINVPVDTVKDKIVSIIPDKSAIIYVYCLTGSRSSQAVSIMKMLGYTQVYSMQYGILGWRAKYYPTE
jgi:rhodanese-related sulfurtransferase